MRKTSYPSAFTQRLVQSRTDGQAAIFNRVMVVDLEIALAFQSQIPAGMFREAGEEVIEKADPSTNRGLTRAIEIQRELDFCFSCLSPDFAYAVCLHSDTQEKMKWLAR